MKSFKIIMNCVVSAILIISITLNVLLLCGFEFVKAPKNADSAPTDNTTTTSESAQNSTDSQSSSNETTTTDVQIPPQKDNAAPTNLCDNKLIYQDDNIKITYIKTTKKKHGVVYECKIENTSSKTLTILFTDVYINSNKVFISGLTCEHLLPDTEALEEFVLSNKDGEAYTPSPSTVSFKIKLQNDKSKLDLYESDRITLKFN